MAEGRGPAVGDDTLAEDLGRGELSDAGSDGEAASIVVFEQIEDVDELSERKSEGGAEPSGEPVPGLPDHIAVDNGSVDSVGLQSAAGTATPVAVSADTGVEWS